MAKELIKTSNLKKSRLSGVGSLFFLFLNPFIMFAILDFKTIFHTLIVSFFYIKKHINQV